MKMIDGINELFGHDLTYMPLHCFTAVDLGYQPGNAVSNIIKRFDENAFPNTYLQLFDQIWHDKEKLDCKELAKRQPLRVVFRDSGFKDDSAKINAEQIFKLLSPHTRGALSMKKVKPVTSKNIDDKVSAKTRNSFNIVRANTFIHAKSFCQLC